MFSIFSVVVTHVLHFSVIFGVSRMWPIWHGIFWWVSIKMFDGAKRWRPKMRAIRWNATLTQFHTISNRSQCYIPSFWYRSMKLKKEKRKRTIILRKRLNLGKCYIWRVSLQSQDMHRIFVIYFINNSWASILFTFSILWLSNEHLFAPQQDLTKLVLL